MSRPNDCKRLPPRRKLLFGRGDAGGMPLLSEAAVTLNGPSAARAANSELSALIAFGDLPLSR
jgi:hypothetical protein